MYEYSPAQSQIDKINLNLEMDVFSFLVANWAQIVVLITAIGTVLKVILDYHIKKKEIKFEFIYKQKAAAFKDYLLSYQNLKNLLIKESFSFIYGNISFGEFETNIKSAIDDLHHKIHSIYMFCSFKEKEQLFSIMNSSTFLIYEIKKSDKANLKNILDNYNNKTSSILDEFIKNFVK